MIKIGVCPICWCKPTKKNPFVRYHIRYNPPLEIYACKYCNWVEHCIRNEIFLKTTKVNFHRINSVINYHKKFNVLL